MSKPLVDPADVQLRMDALEAVTVELLGNLWGALGKDVATNALRQAAEDIIPPSGTADLKFSAAVAALLTRLDERIDPR
ncbi:hypothetical protein D3C71_301780 [compost metagenome]